MNEKRAMMLLGATAALAAAPSRADAAILETDYFQEFFIKGGPIVWFCLLPLSICTISLLIAYALRVKRSYLLPDLVQAQIRNLFEAKQYREAMEFTATDTSMLSRVTHATLVEAANGYAVMERTLEDAVEEETTRAMRRIEWLNVIGNIAPMLGLFGTVVGMIAAFNGIVAAGGMPDPAGLAGGISTALVTTFWGLGVAIPALSIYAVFRNRVDVLSSEVASVAQELISPFRPGQQAAGGQASRPAQQQPRQ